MGTYVKNIADVKMIGRLVRNAEIKVLPSGTKMAEASIAINRNRKNKSGEWETETDYFDLVAWKEIADYMISNTKKGMLVQVDGRLKNRSWDTKDGQKRTIIEVMVNSISPIEPAPISKKPPTPATEARELPKKNEDDEKIYADNGDEIPF